MSLSTGSDVQSLRLPVHELATATAPSRDDAGSWRERGDDP